MQVTKIMVGGTFESNGDYLKATVEGNLEVGESPADALKELGTELEKTLQVAAGMGGDTGGKPATKTKAPAKTAANAPAKKTPAKTVEKKPSGNEKKPAANNRRAARGTTKPKTTPYDRNLKAHKGIFSDLLVEHFGEDWRKANDGAVIAAAGVASKDVLPGVDFLDSDGNVLETFVDVFLSHMNAGSEDDGL